MLQTFFFTGKTLKEQLRTPRELEGHLKSTSRAPGYTRHLDTRAVKGDLGTPTFKALRVL